MDKQSYVIDESKLSAEDRAMLRDFKKAVGISSEDEIDLARKLKLDLKLNPALNRKQRRAAASKARHVR